MNNSIQKEKKKRIVFFENEKKRVILKAIFKNSNLTDAIRKRAYVSLSKLPRNSSKTRLKNRCIITGRSRFTFTKFNLSRLTLRKLICNGLIPGMVKSSW